MFRPSWSGWRAARQAHRKHRALARLARHCHIAAHHPRELARDSEPEPRSPEALSGGGIGLAELLEQLCLLLRVIPMPVSATANSTMLLPLLTLRAASLTS